MKRKWYSVGADCVSLSFAIILAGVVFIKVVDMATKKALERDYVAQKFLEDIPHNTEKAKSEFDGLKFFSVGTSGLYMDDGHEKSSIDTNEELNNGMEVNPDGSIQFWHWHGDWTLTATDEQPVTLSFVGHEGVTILVSKSRLKIIDKRNKK